MYRALDNRRIGTYRPPKKVIETSKTFLTENPTNKHRQEPTRTTVLIIEDIFPTRADGRNKIRVRGGCGRLGKLGVDFECGPPLEAEKAKRRDPEVKDYTSISNWMERTLQFSTFILR